MRERAKMTALIEDLELPLNVHRWRKLESSDPERYDLVRKAQSLQRTLVAKTESTVKKDLLIQEKVRYPRNGLVASPNHGVTILHVIPNPSLSLNAVS